jgi:hypothetical protein
LPSPRVVKLGAGTYTSAVATAAGAVIQWGQGSSSEARCPPFIVRCPDPGPGAGAVAPVRKESAGSGGPGPGDTASIASFEAVRDIACCTCV